MIKFVSEKNSKFLNTKEYHGHGQILKVLNDGCERTIYLEPKDPVFGVKILNLENGEPYLSFPEMISIEHIDAIQNNIDAAKKFCEEFQERKDEFI